MQHERIVWGRPVVGSLLITLASLALALMATGCGGVECADGTVEQDGECVLADDFRCADDEVLEGDECIPRPECGANAEEQDGECVAEEPASCGQDTELDPNLNECFVTDEACGPTTAFSSEESRCVPTDEVCQDGTYFDDDTSLCYPDAQCQPGDVISEDGYCVSVGQDLADRADVEADGVTDPAQEGTPVQMQLDDPGDEVIFKGSIDPPGDDEEQSWDYFEFEAEEGEWFEVTLHSMGLPDPMFEVRAADGGFERFSAEGTGNAKDRQVAIPQDGSYYVVVKPGGSTDGVVAEDDWDYAGTIEQLDQEDAEVFDPSEGSLDGTFGALEDNFFYTDEFEEDERLFIHWAIAPPGVEPALQQWESPTDFVTEHDASGDGVFLTVPESEELYLLVDWVEALGLHFGDYSLSIYDQVIDEFSPGDTTEVDFTAGAGDVVVVEFYTSSTTTLDLDVVITDEDDNVVFDESLDQNDTYSFEVADSGDFTAEYQNNWSFTDYDNFVPMIDVIRRQQIASLDVDEEDLVTVVQHNASGNDLYVEIVDDDANVLAMDEISTDEILDYFVTDDTISTVDVFIVDLYGSSNLNVNATVQSADDGPDFSVDAWDLVMFEQDNPVGQDVFISLEYEDEDEIVFSGWVSADEVIEFLPGEDDGDYSISYFDITGFDDVTIDVDVISPTDVHSFNAEAGAQVEIEQSNDDGHDAILAVLNDNTDELVVYDHLSPDTSYYFDALYAGDNTVYHYDVEGTQGLDVTTDVLNPLELDTFSVDADDAPAVVELSHDYSDELELVLIDDDDDMLVGRTTVEDDLEHADAIVGVESGNFTVGYLDVDDEGLGADDVDLTAEVIVPTAIDYGVSYAGDTNDNWYGGHSYYLLEPSETEMVELTLEFISGGGTFGTSGTLNAFIYQIPEGMIADRALDSNATNTNSVQSQAFEFEADEQYIIRIGYDWSFLSRDIEYEVTFDDL